MLIDLDTDFGTGLPAWDLFIMHQGKRIPVRIPTAQEIARMIDLRHASSEQACIGQINLLAALTGMDRADAARFDPEQHSTFFKALGDLIQKRLEYKNLQRRNQRVVAPPPTDGNDRPN